MTCNIIVQARLGSTRFPGKVMADVNGKPLIGILLGRLEQCVPPASNLIVVMPPYEDELFDYLGTYKVIREELVDCGAQNLAGAFKTAMQDFPAASFCRICADSPLIDPVDVRVTIRRHMTEGNLLTFGGYPEFGAVEVVDWKLFQRCLPKFDEEEREHVTLYFKRRCGLVVDYPEDLERLREILKYPNRSAQACINELAARL